jgi:PPM family protein phosphatase
MTPAPATMLSTLALICPDSPDTAIGELGCTIAGSPGIILLVGAVIVGLAVRTAVRRARERHPHSHAPPVLVFPLDRGDVSRRRTPPGTEPPPRRAPIHDPGPDHRHGSAPYDAAPDPGSRRMTIPPDSPHRPPAAPPPSADRNGGSSSWVEAGNVRFEEPPEGTLQLLPGRLEIESGAGAEGEIRFVRVPGEEPEVTFGRSTGPPYRHVQLRSPTVSRMHARLRFDGGGWTLRNDSGTNPTVLNGRTLDSTEERALSDGDRIEMGEIVFVFRQPQRPDRLPHRSSWYTDRGRRDSNQDAVAVRTLPGRKELAVICDGMGAQAAGRLASHRALEILVETLEQGGELEDAVRAANRAVRERAQGDPDGEGMGTTLVALLREGEEYRIANVGDSRAYRIDAEGIRQLSEDHSFIAEVVREGRMSREEAVRSPWRNAVTRHLGAEDEVEVDIFGRFRADEPHLVLLCSDGAHSVLTAEAMESLVRRSVSVRDMARKVGEAALREGSDDNVSVVVLQFGGGLIPAAASGTEAGSDTG